MRDFYDVLSLRFFLWRREVFPAYYNWKYRKASVKSLKGKFGFVPQVGNYVEDCQPKVQRIVEIDDDLDTVVMEDGSSCSLWNCCSLANDEYLGGW